MRGFYSQELSQGKSVLDKCRTWPAYIELIEDVLERPIRMVCPTRDLKDIVASFERLRRKHPLTAIHGLGADYFAQQTVLGRAQHLLSPQGVVGLPLVRLMDAIDRGYQDRMFFVNYKELMGDPVGVCATAFAFLGLKPMEVDLNNITGPDTSRDIDVWGLPLHTTRPFETVVSHWQEVLPDHVAQWIDTEFACITGAGSK